MVGLLEFYPALKRLLAVRWLDFLRPRPELIDLLGEEHQSCPVLVLKDTPKELGIVLSGVSAMVRPKSEMKPWDVTEPLRIHCH